MALLHVPPPESIFIDVRGATLLGRFYRATGSLRRPTLLAFAGMPGSHLDSSGLGYGLRSVGWNVITFQYRGMWGSSGEPFTSAAQVSEDIAAVIEFAKADVGVDPERLALRGHSTGGWLAGSHAALDSRIRTIVLQSPLVRLPVLPPVGTVPPLVQAVKTGSARGRPWALAVGGADNALRMLPRWREAMGDTWLPLASKLSDRRVLLLSGDKDEAIPFADTEAIANAIQTAEWIRHPEADHNWTGHGQWLLTRIAEWLVA